MVRVGMGSRRLDGLDQPRGRTTWRGVLVRRGDCGVYVDVVPRELHRRRQFLFDRAACGSRGYDGEPALAGAAPRSELVVGVGRDLVGGTNLGPGGYWTRRSGCP